MSFGVCRVEKVKGAAAVAGLQLHNNRERQRSNTNPDIDRSRSGLNYSLIEQSTHSYNKLIEGRLQQGYKGKKAIRKDAVRMCEMLFTSDGEFFARLSEQEQRQFFIDCFEFAAQRYGRENIIAATVHLDEATPHLHLDFVPLTQDGRLSAKEVLGGRKEMQQLQDDFYAFVASKYGLDRGNRADIENGETSRKHLETAEYKEKLARDRIKQAEQTEQKAQRRIQTAKKKTDEAEQLAVTRQHQADEYQQKIKDLQAEIERLQSLLQGLQWHFMTANEVDRLQVQKTVFGALKGITYEECLSLKATAARVEQADEVLSERDKIIADAESEAEQVINKAKSEAGIIISGAESKFEEERNKFHQFRRWADEAYKDYSAKAKQKDEMTGQLQQARERLSEVERQVSSLEQEKDRIQKEIDGLKEVFEQFTLSQDNRYCYLTVDSLVFNRLKETSQEHKIAFQAIRTDDGNFAIRAARSEKEYLANAVVQVQKFVSEQNQVSPPPKRHTPRL